MRTFFHFERPPFTDTPKRRRAFWDPCLILDLSHAAPSRLLTPERRRSGSRQRRAGATSCSGKTQASLLQILNAIVRAVTAPISRRPSGSLKIYLRRIRKLCFVRVMPGLPRSLQCAFPFGQRNHVGTQDLVRLVS